MVGNGHQKRRPRRTVVLRLSVGFVRSRCDWLSGHTPDAANIRTLITARRRGLPLADRSRGLCCKILLYHQTPLLTRTISSAMSCFFFWYAYRVCFTAVRFTSQEITIRIIPFVCFSEKYSDIAALRAGRGNLQIRFTDGKAINMWSGLGSSEHVVSILLNKTEVLPTIE
jgi:hypothetical protein